MKLIIINFQTERNKSMLNKKRDKVHRSTNFPKDSILSTPDEVVIIDDDIYEDVISQRESEVKLILMIVD